MRINKKLIKGKNLNTHILRKSAPSIIIKQQKTINKQDIITSTSIINKQKQLSEKEKIQENKVLSNDFVVKRSEKTREEKLNSQIDVAACSYIGRLGNNLFQMATTLEYGRKYNVPVVFDQWLYDGKEYDASIIFETKMQFIKYPSDFVWNLYEDPFHYYKPVPYIKNIRFHGFFQSYKYFDEQATKDFFAPNLQYVINPICDKYSYLFSKKTTSIHCRRGDYVNNTMFYPLSVKYYNEAMQRTNDFTDIYVVFSDDIEWCKQNIVSQNGKEMLYVENNPDYIDLFLMSMCDNNIIANSSFSWWGAYLNKNSYKVIITPNPKEWFTPKSEIYDKTFDLCPSNWIIADNI